MKLAMWLGFFWGAAVGSMTVEVIHRSRPAEAPYDLMVCGGKTYKMYFPYSATVPKGCVATGKLEAPR